MIVGCALQAGQRLSGVNQIEARRHRSTLSIFSHYHSRFSAYVRSLRRMKIGETMAPSRNPIILLKLSRYLPQKVNQIEVTCELMQADFSYVFFYTFA